MWDSSRLVSVIVPVYNVEKFAQAAIESITRQTYSNLQIIVVDDHSTDRTYEIISELAKKDPRIQLVKNERNSKIVASLNAGLKLAKGEFIARSDGDDIMLPDRIERQLEHLDKNPQIALVGCSFDAIDENGDFIRKSCFPGDSDLVSRLLPYCSPVSHIWLARREIYDALEGYRMASVEDYDFLLRADARGFKLDNLSDYYGQKVRMRAGNTVSTFGLAQRRLFNYSKKLYLAEKRKEPVEFSEITEQELIQNSTSGPLFQLHRLSDKASQLGAKTAHPAAKNLLYVLSALVSPIKAQYFYLKFMRHVTIRSYAREKARNESV